LTHKEQKVAAADTGARFKEADAASYDPLTEEFDRFSPRVSTPFVRQMIELASVSTGERLLDVGTGTGIVAIEAAKAIGPTGRVVGVDLSENMLAAARAKAEHLGLSRISGFHRMDAERLELPDGSFDTVLCLFALLHFPDPVRALLEMRRVMKPGGRLVLAVGSRPPRSIRALVHYVGRLPGYVRELGGRQLVGPRFLDSLVRSMCPPSPEPEESLTARSSLNRTGQTRSLVARAGFTQIDELWSGHALILPTVDEFWDMQRTFSSVARKRLAAAPESVREAVEAEFRKRCNVVLARGGELVYPYGAFMLRANRPLSDGV
jgi:ubiquinone/menaquinone biosynthesis C-methylase UbiE